MAQRGKPSTAHVYGDDGSCIYCHMYENQVVKTSHVCLPEREAIADAATVEVQNG